MQSLAQSGYTFDQVLAQLYVTGGTRRDHARYVVRDSNGQFVRELTNVVRDSVAVKRDWTAGRVDQGTPTGIHGNIDFTLLDIPLELGSYLSKVLSEMPVLFYRFQEQSGTTAEDSSPNGRDGTINGTPGTHYELANTTLLQNDSTDYSIRFLGSASGYVSRAHDSSFDFTEFTIAVVTQTTSTSAGTIAQIADKFKLEMLATSGKVKLTLDWDDASTTEYTSDSRINDGKRHHLRVVLSASRLQIYDNYGLIIDAAVSKTLDTPTAALEIGKSFTGIIDEFALFDKALTRSTVREFQQVVADDLRQFLWELDYIQPYFGFYMPDGGLVEWPQGYFKVVNPDYGRSKGVNRWTCHGVDPVGELRELTFTSRYLVETGDNPITHVKTILESRGFFRHNLTATTKTLSVDFDFPKADKNNNLLFGCNALLVAAGYFPLFTDEQGQFVGKPKASIADKAPDFRFYIKPGATLAHEQSMALADGRTYSTTIIDAPNEINVVGSSLDAAIIKGTAQNTNASNPASIPMRQNIVIPKDLVLTIPPVDQPTADEIADTELEERSQVCRNIRLPIVPSYHWGGPRDIAELHDYVMETGDPRRYLIDGYEIRPYKLSTLLLSSCFSVN